MARRRLPSPNIGGRVAPALYGARGSGALLNAIFRRLCLHRGRKRERIRSRHIPTPPTHMRIMKEHVKSPKAEADGQHSLARPLALVPIHRSERMKT